MKRELYKFLSRLLGIIATGLAIVVGILYILSKVDGGSIGYLTLILLLLPSIGLYSIKEAIERKMITIEEENRSHNDRSG